MCAEPIDPVLPLGNPVHYSEHGHLKARMLRDAVQENADTMAGALPPPLRPARRLWGRVRFLVVPASILVTLFVARWTLAAQPAAIVAQVAEATSPNGVVEPAPASPPDLSLLNRPLPARALALGVRRIVLDAGHGGAHQGTASANGLLEKNITLDLAERTKRLLVAKGFEVVMTRSSDDTLSLKERATTANQQRGDIFVSIHLNSLRPDGPAGIETYYLGPSEHPDHDAIASLENEHSGYAMADLRTLLDGIYLDARRDESKRLAQSVQQSIMRRMRKADPDIDDRGVKTAPFVVLVATEMPAILAEVSCLSNAGEAERLGKPDHRQAIAEALAGGIHSFINPNTHSQGKRKDSHER